MSSDLTFKTFCGAKKCRALACLEQSDSDNFGDNCKDAACFAEHATSWIGVEVGHRGHLHESWMKDDLQVLGTNLLGVNPEA